MELRKTVNPSALGVQVTAVRRVGNAGVLLQTTCAESAERLRGAVPATLRVAEPRKKRPLVALPDLDRDYTHEELCDLLKTQNFAGDTTWTLQRIKEDLRVAFMRSRRQTSRRTVVVEVSHQLRDAIVGRDRVFIGWDAVRPYDYLSVTCCNKCHMYTGTLSGTAVLLWIHVGGAALMAIGRAAVRCWR